MTTVFVLLGILMAGSVTADDEITDPRSLPRIVRERAEGYLVMNLGQRIFESHVVFHFARFQKGNPDAPSWSFSRRPNYLLTYCFSGPDHAAVAARIKLYVTEDGRHLEPYPKYDVPPCADKPDECTIWLDPDEAVSIARESGFPKGEEDWVVEFKFEATLSTFVWAIYATSGCSRSGYSVTTLLIDANSGEVWDDQPVWTGHDGRDCSGNTGSVRILKSACGGAE